MRLIVSSLALAFLAGACASSTDTPVEENAAAASAELSNYERAIATVTTLEEAGNEQTAIDRLTQLLGDPGMNDAQMAEALYRRALLRYGEGNDVEGAISDLQEISSDYPGSDVASDARALLSEAALERDMLVEMLETGSLSPMERFEILFRLGRHQEAGDIMMASALQPDMEYLLDMYQIGYLCDGEELAGPIYQITEPDGTMRSVQFCDLGK